MSRKGMKTMNNDKPWRTNGKRAGATVKLDAQNLVRESLILFNSYYLSSRLLQGEAVCFKKNS